MHEGPDISVIVSTYNAEAWLDKVLHGYRRQRARRFELIIADDGSADATRQLIERHARDFPVPLRHAWHADDGYQRQRILNRAITLAAHPYIVFSDGDCIPRPDFVQIHARLARPGTFLSGGYCKLNMAASSAISHSDIDDGRCFAPRWLATHGALGMSNRLKLGGGRIGARVLDAVTPTRPTFNNCNSSAWAADLLAINGYDERMKYGGPDRELGERLENAGIRGRQIRHRAVVVHLDHARGYKTAESVQANLAIRARTRADKVVVTPHGIVQGSPRHAPVHAHAPAYVEQPLVDTATRA